MPESMRIRTHTIREDEPLPLIIETDDAPTLSALIDWLRKEAAWIDGEILRSGGVLLRGFPVFDEESFEHVASAALPRLLPYLEGQSPRTKLRDGVYTSTEYPQRLSITLHSELSYTAQPPQRLVFGCQTPPETGGETPIVDCRKAYARMDPGLRSRFEREGILYVKNMHGSTSGMGKSWQQHFETSDRSVVEEYLGQNDIEFCWLANDGLKTAQRRPAVRTHPTTGELAWHNQAHLWHVTNHPRRTQEQLLKYFGEDELPTHAYFGDGTPISLEELDHVRDVLWETSSSFPWERGDVLILDNYLVAHGRRPFKGPRKVVVAMG